LVSFAENNFGPTAAWKNMLDWLSRTVPGTDPNNDWKKTLGSKENYN
jgi:NAD(P)H-dependent FMN reductase